MQRCHFLLPMLLVPAVSGAAVTCRAECDQYMASQYVAS